MIRLAVSALHQNSELQECSMVSIANSVMLAAQLRLEINTSLGHAWLIPYKRVCTFQPGYRGLIELAHRSGRVHDVNAHLVYERDVFELEYGDSPRCYHKPALRDRGPWVGAYSTIRYKEGAASSLFLFRDEVEEIRDKASRSKDSEYGPWKKYPDEMIRKTPTKRHLKYARMSIEDLSRAIGLDDQAEAAASATSVEYDPKRVPQDLVLEGNILDMAEEATHELKGSVERQQEVAQEKINRLKQQEKTAGGSAPTLDVPNDRVPTDAENRALDAEILAREAGGTSKFNFRRRQS
jgi:recombination protein RecT